MPPFKNLLSLRKGPITTVQETADDTHQIEDKPRPSFEQRSNAMNVKVNPDEPNEFKLSEIDDSGVYLPPSPPEKKSFWGKSPTSTVSSNHRTLLCENEPFSISRESFESYRRSFDISARSPIPSADHVPTRSSLQIDSRPLHNPVRSPLHGNAFRKHEFSRDQETEFEDVRLHDESNKTKKRGFLSRFGDSTPIPEPAPTVATDASKHNGHFGFHISGHGRKRGQSGVGSELGSMDRTVSAPK